MSRRVNLASPPRTATLALLIALPACGSSRPVRGTSRGATPLPDELVASVQTRSGPVCSYLDVSVSARKPEGEASIALPESVEVQARPDALCSATVSLYPADGNVLELPIGSAGAPEPVPLRGREVVDRTLTLTQRAAGGSWSVEVAQEDFDKIGLRDSTLHDFSFDMVRLVALRLRKRTEGRMMAYDTRTVAEDPEVDRHDCKPGILVVPYVPEEGRTVSESALPAELIPRAPEFIQVCSLEDEGVVALAIHYLQSNTLGLRISTQAFGVAPIDVVIPVGDENVIVADVLIDVF